MEQFAQEITVIDLPSLTWSIHIQEKYEFIAILHVKLTSDEIIIDKGIVLTEGDDKLEVKVFLNGLVAHLPNITSTPTVPELSTLVAILHKQKVCLNAADNVSHPHCVKLVQNSVCKEESGSAKYCKVCKNNRELPDPNPILLEECDELIKKEEIQIDFPNEELDSETTQFTDKRGLCNVCGKIFSSTYRMQEHLLTHSSEKKFQCKTCDKTFTKSFNLRMHEHTHSGERPYVCNDCGKSYTTGSNLRSHTLSSHKEGKNHMCEICKMTFLYPRYLKLHMRKHTGERPYLCNVCDKKFVKKVHLTVHMRIHTGEKPYCCAQCGKCFTTTGALSSHKRTHLRPD